MAQPTTRAEFTEWRSRNYYIMKNKTTGKMYVGQTVQNLEIYLGSGTYWKNHCNKHNGYTRENIELVDSVWIETEDEAKLWLNKLEKNEPEYWLSKRWANQIPETTNDNTFYGPTVNEMRVRKGIHPFLKENKTKILEDVQAKTRFGTEKHKKAIYKKYKVDNVMRVPEIAKRSGKIQSITKKINGTAKGSNNSKAKSITVNGINFGTMKDASKHFQISLYYLRKLSEKNSIIEINIEELRQRTKKYGSTNK